MLNPVYCNGCGRRLEVPAGFGKAKMRCDECGVFTELPKEVREQGQEAEQKAPAPARPPVPAQPPTPAQPPRPKLAPRPQPTAPTPTPADDDEDNDSYEFREESEADAPPAHPARARRPEPEREVLVKGTEDDDLNPYTVTGDAVTKKCPGCDKRVDARDAACVHCGYNFETKKKAKRVYELVNKEWEVGWPHQKRVMLFIGLQVVNFVTLVMSLFAGYGGISFTLVIMSVGLQAFLCGTYDRLTLTRTAKGKVTLTTTRRYLFLAQAPKTINWKEHDSVITIQTNEFDPIDWCMFFILLGYCIVPGALFWWYVIRPDKYTVTLCKDHGMPETPIFPTSDPERAREVMTTVSEVTTLPIHK